MALPAIVDSLDSVPEPVRAHYTQASDGDIKGKFVLGVEERAGYKLDNVAPLRSSLEHSREDYRKAREKLQAFGDLTPEAVAELRGTVEKLKGNVPKDQLDAMLSAELGKHRKDWDEQRKTIEGKATTYETMLRKTLIDSEAARALASAGAKPESIKLLLHELRGMADVEIPQDATASPRVFLKNEAGGRRTTHRSGSTGDMTIEEWANDFARKDFPFLFDAGGASGGGRNGAGSRSGGAGGFTISAADARDPAKYRAAEDAATKAGQELIIVR